MIVVKKFSTPRELAQFLRGTEIAQGSLTSAITSAKAMANTAATFETDEVAADDVVYFAGVAGSNTVASVDSETEITLGTTTTVDDGADYRICRDAGATLFGSDKNADIFYDTTSSTWVLIYDTAGWAN